MKTLIAVASCHGREAYADAQRATWVKDVEGADVRFFQGRPAGLLSALAPHAADDVWLDAPDSYELRKVKVLAMMAWALEQGYDYMWKTDDDVYLRPDRLLELPQVHYQGLVITTPGQVNYEGRVIHAPKGAEGLQACHGFLYGLSRRAMAMLVLSAVAADHWPRCTHEDIWVGLQLRSLGVLPVHLGGVGGFLRITHQKGVPNNWPNQECPTPRNLVVASFEYTPEQLVEIHTAFQ